MQCQIFIFSLFFSILVLIPISVQADNHMPGPMAGDVISVLDGDTVTVRLHIWIGQNVETKVRIAGIDTPEMHSSCGKERKMAIAARRELVQLLSDGKVILSDIRLAKYAGRVLASAQTSKGIDIKEHMIKKGFARAYHGKKRESWCVS